MGLLRSIKKTFAPSGPAAAGAPAEGGWEEVCRASGLRPIDPLRTSDIIIAGYPKSGNTWMQYLIAGAFYGLDLTIVPDALVQDLVPDVHFKKVIKHYYPVTFFKSHFLPRPDYRNVIYLLRDGRDAMVSYWHYLQALTDQPIDFLDMVRSGTGLFPCKWHTHVEQGLANPCGARMMTVRYEDLKEDTARELRRIGEFAGLACETAVLEQAARKGSFSPMKAREASFAWENPQIPKNKPFVRRGRVGSHLEEMPSTVRQAFVEEAREVLKKTGYLE